MLKTIPYNQLGKAGYNRSINRTRVNKIKREFTDDLVNPAIVSFRDGQYWIVDHQHQTQAIYELNGCDPNTPIQCDVRTGLTYEQEADLYLRINTSTKIVTFAEELKGRIEAKDAESLRFRDVVESCGYTVLDRTSTSLRALNAAWRIFRKVDGEKELTSILELTHACWPENANSAESIMIWGVSLFLKNHGDEYDRGHFIAALSAIEPKEAIRKARIYYKQMDSKAFTRQYCMYTILVNYYNDGYRNKLMHMPPRV